MVLLIFSVIILLLRLLLFFNLLFLFCFLLGIPFSLSLFSGLLLTEVTLDGGCCYFHVFIRIHKLISNILILFPLSIILPLLILLHPCPQHLWSLWIIHILLLPSPTRPLSLLPLSLRPLHLMLWWSTHIFLLYHHFISIHSYPPSLLLIVMFFHRSYIVLESWVFFFHSLASLAGPLLMEGWERLSGSFVTISMTCLKFNNYKIKN